MSLMNAGDSAVLPDGQDPNDWAPAIRRRRF
jgi:hypothetical protein